jgi:hypothetical protein
MTFNLDKIKQYRAKNKDFKTVLFWQSLFKEGSFKSKHTKIFARLASFIFMEYQFTIQKQVLAVLDSCFPVIQFNDQYKTLVENDSWHKLAEKLDEINDELLLLIPKTGRQSLSTDYLTKMLKHYMRKFASFTSDYEPFTFGGKPKNTRAFDKLFKSFTEVYLPGVQNSPDFNQFKVSRPFNMKSTLVLLNDERLLLKPGFFFQYIALDSSECFRADYMDDTEFKESVIQMMDPKQTIPEEEQIDPSTIDFYEYNSANIMNTLDSEDDMHSAQADSADEVVDDVDTAGGFNDDEIFEECKNVGVKVFRSVIQVKLKIFETVTAGELIFKHEFKQPDFKTDVAKEFQHIPDEAFSFSSRYLIAVITNALLSTLNLQPEIENIKNLVAGLAMEKLDVKSQTELANILSHVYLGKFDNEPGYYKKTMNKASKSDIQNSARANSYPSNFGPEIIATFNSIEDTLRSIRQKISLIHQITRKFVLAYFASPALLTWTKQSMRLLSFAPSCFFCIAGEYKDYQSSTIASPPPINFDITYVFADLPAWYQNISQGLNDSRNDTRKYRLEFLLIFCRMYSAELINHLLHEIEQECYPCEAKEGMISIVKQIEAEVFSDNFHLFGVLKTLKGIVGTDFDIFVDFIWTEYALKKKDADRKKTWKEIRIVLRLLAASGFQLKFLVKNFEFKAEATAKSSASISILGQELNRETWEKLAEICGKTKPFHVTNQKDKSLWDMNFHSRIFLLTQIDLELKYYNKHHDKYHVPSAEYLAIMYNFDSYSELVINTLVDIAGWHAEMMYLGLEAENYSPDNKKIFYKNNIVPLERKCEAAVVATLNIMHARRLTFFYHIPLSSFESCYYITKSANVRVEGENPESNSALSEHPMPVYISKNHKLESRQLSRGIKMGKKKFDTYQVVHIDSIALIKVHIQLRMIRDPTFQETNYVFPYLKEDQIKAGSAYRSYQLKRVGRTDSFYSQVNAIRREYINAGTIYDADLSKAQSQQQHLEENSRATQEGSYIPLETKIKLGFNRHAGTLEIMKESLSSKKETKAYRMLDGYIRQMKEYGNDEFKANNIFLCSHFGLFVDSLRGEIERNWMNMAPSDPELVKNSVELIFKSFKEIFDAKPALVL